MKSIPWNEITDRSQLDSIEKESQTNYVLIFKHSTRCSISSLALSRFERGYVPQDSIKLYFLNLLSYREISNEIDSRFKVRHESPQILLIDQAKVIYHASHNGIKFKKVLEHLEAVNP